MSLTEPAPSPVKLILELVFRVSFASVPVDVPVSLLMPEKEVVPTDPAREVVTVASPVTLMEPVLSPLTFSKEVKLRAPLFTEPVSFPLRVTVRLPVERVSVPVPPSTFPAASLEMEAE